MLPKGWKVVAMPTSVLKPSSRGLELLILLLALRFCKAGYESIIGAEIPNFTGPISNLTVPLGREAVLECGIDNLSAFKVAWLRVDTQTILTIHSHVITKNHRIAVTHTEHRNWYLHIRDVRQSDMGWYMCQINTDPMKSQVGFLNVVVPPDIMDNETSADMVAREGQNISLKCAANGSPTPTISWRREGGDLINLGNGEENSLYEGSILNLTKVNRLHMDAYLCIASNGVPPTVSKRIMLIVHFPPMISIQNQLVGASEGDQITLECHAEAFPKSINYWTKNDGHIIISGVKYEPVFIEMHKYKVYMKLTIRNVNFADFGTYKCVAKNSLGETDGTIKLDPIPTPATLKTTTIKSTKPPPVTKNALISKSKLRPPQKETLVDLTVNEITQKIPNKEHANLNENQQSQHSDIEQDIFIFTSSSSSSSLSSSSIATSIFSLSFNIRLIIIILIKNLLL